MSNQITDRQIADRLTQYGTLLRSAYKSLIRSDETPLAMHQILSTLEEKGQMRMGDIADVLGVSRPNLTPLVDKLEALRYVERSASDQDRRVVYIKITDTGMALLNKEKENVSEKIEKTLSKLSGEEINRLMDSLQVVSDYLSRA